MHENAHPEEQVGWSREDRLRFADSLDRTKRQLVAFYRGLLVLVALVVVGFVAVVLWRTDSMGAQGEGFYFAILVLLVLGWIGSRLRSLRPSRRPELEVPPVRTRVEEVEGGKLFELTIGTPPETSTDPTEHSPTGAETRRPGRTFTFSRSFQGEVPLPSFLRKRLADRLPVDRPPGDADRLFDEAESGQDGSGFEDT